MNRFLLFLLILLIIVVVVSGYFAWRGSNQASVLVEWTTASELDTAGFNVYRSLEPDGPFEKITVQMIGTSGDPLTGGAYSYEDRLVKPGVVYYYQIEEVEMDGGSSRFGPISVQASGGVSPWIFVMVIVLIISLSATLLFRHRTINAVPAVE